MMDKDVGDDVSDSQTTDMIKELMRKNEAVNVLYKMGSKGSAFFERVECYMDNEMNSDNDDFYK